VKLFGPEGQEQRLQQIAQRYADIIRAGLGLTAWTLVALIGLATAFLAGKLIWSLLMLALRWIARI